MKRLLPPPPKSANGVGRECNLFYCDVFHGSNPVKDGERRVFSRSWSPVTSSPSQRAPTREAKAPSGHQNPLLNLSPSLGTGIDRVTTGMERFEGYYGMVRREGLLVVANNVFLDCRKGVLKFLQFSSAASAGACQAAKLEDDGIQNLRGWSPFQP